MEETLIFRGAKLIYVENMRCASRSMVAALEQHFSHGHMVSTGHQTIDQIQKNHIFFTDNITDYVSFAFVRNPWDHMVSCWKYLSKHNLADPDWDKFLEKIDRDYEEYILWKDWQFAGLFNRISVNDKIAVDFVGRFEDLQNDWQKLCNIVGEDIKLTKLNVSDDERLYINFYKNEHQKKIVEKIYFEDIRKFGYGI